jgi:5'-3' exonuclease
MPPPAWLSGTTEVEMARETALAITGGGGEMTEEDVAEAEMAALLAGMQVVDDPASGSGAGAGGETKGEAKGGGDGVEKGEASLKAKGEALKNVSAEDKFKAAYYLDKFGVGYGAAAAAADRALQRRVVKAYLEGLLWTYHYYYNGVASWNWFYPFHYAPMCSDLTELPNLGAAINFSTGRPFKPFQQLIGCLPPGSSNFLPDSYRELMVSRTSPIIDLYPLEFKIDMNGKRNP